VPKRASALKKFAGQLILSLSLIPMIENKENKNDAVSPKPVFKSEELFRGSREIRIIHEGAEYRLLVTKTGKLILNK